MAGRYRALLSGALAGIPVGSIYAWSVYVNPVLTARPEWGNAGAHATSVVIAALAVSAAISGRVVSKSVSVRLLCLWGAILSGAGFLIGGLAVGFLKAPAALFYIGAFTNGFGLAHCYVAMIKCTMAWWGHKKGFASGYIMAITSSGSFVFAWINNGLLDSHGPAWALVNLLLFWACKNP